MVRVLTLLALVLALAAPLWAVKLKLKAEEKDFEADIVSIVDGEVTYRKGRREYTVPLEDFETASQFAAMQAVSGNVVRIPPSTWHKIEAVGGPMCYLAVDCFLGGRPAAEPTWDDHVKAVCAREGWDFNAVRQ